MRGYSIVALDNPKSELNVGSAMRAVGVYSAASLIISGKRCKAGITDTMKHYKHIPFFRTKDLHDALPFDCIPVAIDLIDGAIPLPDFAHPERAFYVFGAEDATLGSRILSWCKHAVYVPTNGCMNLAATVNVVLYDRMQKQMNKLNLEGSKVR